MKAVNLRKLVLAFLLCALAAVAQNTDPRLVGSWTQEGNAAATWTFRNDGSGFIEQADPRTTARFNWSCHGIQLQVSTGGLSVPYTVVSNDGSSMVLRNDQAATVYKLRKRA